MRGKGGLRNFLESASTLGERLTSDLFERRFYSQDMASPPAFLVRPFYRTLPDAVALPECANEVAEVVRQAVSHGLAVIPRAAATTALFNVVPLRGGLVVDLNRLNGVIDIDDDRHTVTVKAATRWLDLQCALAQGGWSVKSYPSSAVAATVGGWISTQGHGLGSLKYGPLLSQVVQAKVVLADGKIMRVSQNTHPPLEWFAAAEGTLGVVTEIELAIRPTPQVSACHILAFDDLSGLQTTMAELARSEPKPYTLFFSDEIHARMLRLSGYMPSTARSSLLINHQGDAIEVQRGEERIRKLSSGEVLAGELALDEWNDRLYHLRVKRGGPSLLGAEMWLPIDGLASYLKETRAMSKMVRTPIGSYGLVISPNEVMLMSVYHCEARKPLDYTLALGLMGQLYRLGAHYGGRPYGVGLWNTPYLAHIFSRRQLAELRARKRSLDPTNRLNPGKLYRAHFPLWPSLFKSVLALMATGYRMRVRERVGNGGE